MEEGRETREVQAYEDTRARASVRAVLSLKGMGMRPHTARTARLQQQYKRTTAHQSPRVASHPRNGGRTWGRHAEPQGVRVLPRDRPSIPAGAALRDSRARPALPSWPAAGPPHLPLRSLFLFPSPSSRSFLRQPPLPGNMLLSHITLTPAWAWAWAYALLPVLVTYAVFSRVRTWLRLRHIPGPPLVGWSKAWLLRKALGGRFHLDTAEVCEKYGQCRRRARNGKGFAS